MRRGRRVRSPWPTQKSLLPLEAASVKQMQVKLNRLQQQGVRVSVTFKSQSFHRGLARIVDLESNRGLLTDRIRVERTVSVVL